MKYIKSFEKISNKPKVGDYVILNDTFKIDDNYKKFTDFINNNVGKIVKVNKKIYDSVYIDISFDIQYENIPKDILICFKIKTIKEKIVGKLLSVPESDIDKIFKNKIDAETYLSSKKYNL